MAQEKKELRQDIYIYIVTPNKIKVKSYLTTGKLNMFCIFWGLLYDKFDGFEVVDNYNNCWIYGYKMLCIINLY